MINKQAFLMGYKQGKQMVKLAAREEDEEKEQGLDWKDYAMLAGGLGAGGLGLGFGGRALYNYLNQPVETKKDLLTTLSTEPSTEPSTDPSLLKKQINLGQNLDDFSGEMDMAANLQYLKDIAKQKQLKDFNDLPLGKKVRGYTNTIADIIKGNNKATLEEINNWIGDRFIDAGINDFDFHVQDNTGIDFNRMLNKAKQYAKKM